MDDDECAPKVQESHFWGNASNGLELEMLQGHWGLPTGLSCCVRGGSAHGGGAGGGVATVCRARGEGEESTVEGGGHDFLTY